MRANNILKGGILMKSISENEMRNIKGGCAFILIPAILKRLLKYIRF